MAFFLSLLRFWPEFLPSKCHFHQNLKNSQFSPKFFKNSPFSKIPTTYTLFPKILITVLDPRCVINWVATILHNKYANPDWQQLLVIVASLGAH
jgi:hypothetical protein